jgi:hypothetical protein
MDKSEEEQMELYAEECRADAHWQEELREKAVALGTDVGVDMGPATVPAEEICVAKDPGEVVYQHRPGVSTSCRDCVFADYEQFPAGAAQRGCHAGRISLLKAGGANVVEVEDAPGEGAHRFFVIEERACMFHRLKPWGDDLTVEQRLKLARNEMEIRLKVFVIIKMNDVDGAIKTAESLFEQTKNPYEVEFVVEKPQTKTAKLVSFMRDNAKFPWKINKNKDSLLDVGNGIDASLSKCRSTYYATFKAGFVVPPEFTAEVGEAIHDRMERFLVLTPVDEAGNGKVVQTIAHRRVGGNHAVRTNEEYGESKLMTDVVEKIRFVADDQGLDNKIKSVRKVLPCMSQK